MIQITCREFLDLLLDFVADELPAEHRVCIEQHLVSCQCCHAYFESYQITIKMTRQLPCRPVPDRLTEKLRAALEALRREGEGGEL